MERDEIFHNFLFLGAGSDGREGAYNRLMIQMY